MKRAANAVSALRLGPAKVRAPGAVRLGSCPRRHAIVASDALATVIVVFATTTFLSTLDSAPGVLLAVMVWAVGTAAGLLTLCLLGAWTAVGFGPLRLRTITRAAAAEGAVLLSLGLLMTASLSATSITVAAAIIWGLALASSRYLVIDRTLGQARRAFIVVAQPEVVTKLEGLIAREGNSVVGHVSFVSHSTPEETLAAIDVLRAREPLAMVVLAPPERGPLAGAAAWRMATQLPACAVIPTPGDSVASVTGRLWRAGSLHVVLMRSGWSDRVRTGVKRALDVTLSATGLIVLMPALALIGICIATTSRGPIMYRQSRVGRRGKEFQCLKFRTMRCGPSAVPNAHESIGAAVGRIKRDEASRVTPVGAWLRRFGLDELPQLMNVILGDMSLVGPRPLRPFEVAALEDKGRMRLMVRPGITGTWQAFGRDAICWDERVLLDDTYAATWNLTGDLRLLARTLATLPQGQGR